MYTLLIASLSSIQRVAADIFYIDGRYISWQGHFQQAMTSLYIMLEAICFKGINTLRDRSTYSIAL